MEPMELRRIRPGQRISGVARVVGVREEELGDEPIRVLELRNGTGSAQALLRPVLEPAASPLQVGELVEAHGMAEAQWRGGPVALRLDEVRRIHARELVPTVRGGIPPEPEVLAPGILLELSSPIAAYLLWLTSRDLERWTDRRRTKLSRDEIRSLALFLHDQLPEALTTPLPPLPPVTGATPKRRAA